MILNKTIWKLIWGGTKLPEETRFFLPEQMNDAILRFSERVVAADFFDHPTDYVQLSRLPDSIHPEGMVLMGWTKMGPNYVATQGSSDLDTLIA